MWKCAKCGEQIEDGFQACWKCGSGKNGTPPLDQQAFTEQKDQQVFTQQKDQQAFMQQKEMLKTEVQRQQLRYPALGVIAGVYRLLAWFVAIFATIGVLVGLGNLGGYRASFGIPLLFTSVIGGSIGFVTLLAASEGIKVLIDIEENTRIAASSATGKSKK